SEFRLVAIASGGAGYFGTGATTVTTTQDLVLLSGLPPLVREGDQYSAIVTVRNASTRPLSVDVVGSMNRAAVVQLPAQPVQLPAGQSRDLSWRVTAPVGQGSARWEVSAKETAGAAADALRITQSITPAFPVRTYQATITQLKPGLHLPVQRPAGAVPGR